jgi:nitrile hydratase accessory protein
MSRPPEPVFEAPWHAQLFALTVHLNEAGYFAWPDWAERFGAVLTRHGVDKSLNGGDDYFSAWLEALEGYMGELGVAASGDLRRLRAAWEEAYLSTPHGHPVHLGTD